MITYDEIEAYSQYDHSEDVEHYGRLGMKWYEHIYGDYQGAAKYADKGEKINEKLSKKKAKIDSKATGLASKSKKLAYKSDKAKNGGFLRKPNEEKSTKLAEKSAKADYESKQLNVKSQKIGKKLMKNQKIIDECKKKVSDIEKEQENKERAEFENDLMDAMLSGDEDSVMKVAERYRQMSGADSNGGRAKTRDSESKENEGNRLSDEEIRRRLGR